MIKPTLGRTVLVFRPAAGPMFQPALICHVHSEARINVGGFDCMGAPFSETSVLLLQPGETPTPGQIYAVWPPRDGAAAPATAAAPAAPLATDLAALAAAGTDAAVEAACQARHLVAPRVTAEKIDQAIESADFHVFPGTTLTVCCLKLRNGFCVVGESAAASPANFDEQLGRAIALKAARDKVWALEGYLLRSRLAGESK